MTEGSTIFDDRRVRHERRQQRISTPASLDRRKNSRRQKRFSARAWWLDTDYVTELVSEQSIERKSATEQRHDTPDPSENSKQKS